jgi:hypothetical protein
MAAARIAAVIFASFLTAYSAAQQSTQAPRGHLLIKVVDRDGAFLPGAQVVVDHGSTAITDSDGNATVDLSIGTYVIRVLKSGYENAGFDIHIQRTAANNPWPIRVVLHKISAPCGGPSICVDLDLAELIPTDSVSTQDHIPLEPLHDLDPLPSQSPKRR